MPYVLVQNNIIRTGFDIISKGKDITHTMKEVDQHMKTMIPIGSYKQKYKNRNVARELQIAALSYTIKMSDLESLGFRHFLVILITKNMGHITRWNILAPSGE